MYMLWMVNVLAMFQTEITPTYKPMDHFQNRLEGKQQGEQADLWKVFPRKFHLEFHGNLLYRHVCFSLHLFLFLQPFQFQKGMNTERSNSSSQICSHLGPQIF